MDNSNRIQQIDERLDYILSLLEKEEDGQYESVIKRKQPKFNFNKHQDAETQSDISSRKKPTKKKPKKASSKPKKKNSLKQKFKNILKRTRSLSKSVFFPEKPEKTSAPKIENGVKKPKVPDIESNIKSNKYGEIGDILGEARKKDIEFEKQTLMKIKEEQKAYSAIQNNIDTLNKKYEKAGFFEKAKILADIAYEKSKLLAKKSYDWVTDKTKQATHILEQGKSFISSIVDKINNLKKKLPSHLLEFFSKFKSQGKLAQGILRKIPLIGNILSLVFGAIELAQAKTNKDVREIFGKSLGSSIGGIIGFIVGSVFTPIVGAIVSIITAFIGEYVGKYLSYFGIEPIDFIPFDCYDLPLEAKIEILQEQMKYAEIPSIFYNKKLFEDALLIGKGLEETSNSGILEAIATKTNQALETATGIDIDGDGEVKNILEKEAELDTKVDDEPKEANIKPEPTEVDGAVIQVNRTYKGKDFQGRDFVGGTISIVDGKRNVLYTAATIERGQEGLQSGKNLRIPAGTYNLTWHYGSKHKDVPKVYNDKIPQSRAILLHKGWSVAWTAGCVVFAHPEQPKIGKNSKATFQSDERKFVKVLKELLYADGTIKPKGDLPIKLQIFNNFKEDDSFTPRKSKIKEVEQPQEIVNNRTLVIIDD